MKKYRWVITYGLVAVLVLATADNATGQVGEGPRAERLRQMIEDRFATQVQQELRLDDDSFAEMRKILAVSAERRRAMESDERAAQVALRNQLRPGVAAKTDSVTALLEKLSLLRIQYAEAARDELRELSRILSPVQQAQYLLIRDRLMSRAQELRSQRGPGGGPPGSPGGIRRP